MIRNRFFMYLRFGNKNLWRRRTRTLLLGVSLTLITIIATLFLGYSQGASRQMIHQDHSTVRWELRDPGAGTDLVVEREGNLLVAKGKFKGKEVAKEFKVDSLPWYQFVEVSLAAFVRSDEEKTEFWIIEPSNLKHYKMVALKQKTEYITINNQEAEAVRIKVTLPGMASLFWSTLYWYRKSDGVYLRFEGVRGGPGTPKTIVELISETNS